jgi:hypothetical protein
MGLVVATKAFFKLMFNRELSDSFQQLLAGSQPDQMAKLESSKATQATEAQASSEPPPAKPVRNDAINLLAALQREARFLDIVSEPLSEYSDAQVGAAARDVLQNSGKVVERMFGVQPLTDAIDGSTLETPAEFDPAHYRLTGNVTGNAPFSGTVAHHGWVATRCEIPNWSGRPDSALIVAPVELEIG